MVELADTDLAAARWAADQADAEWILLTTSVAAAHTTTVVVVVPAFAETKR